MADIYDNYTRRKLNNSNTYDSRSQIPIGGIWVNIGAGDGLPAHTVVVKVGEDIWVTPTEEIALAALSLPSGFTWTTFSADAQDAVRFAARGRADINVTPYVTDPRQRVLTTLGDNPPLETALAAYYEAVAADTP